MKYIKDINEAFIHSHNQENEIIKPIWGIDEDDLFNYLSDITDEFDAEIKCSFQLVSPKGIVYELRKSNIEVIESYASAGFKRQIMIVITVPNIINDNNTAKAKSLLIDCIKGVDDYDIYDIHESGKSIQVLLCMNNGKKVFNTHKKTNRYFEDIIKGLGQNYDTTIIKYFKLKDKYYQKYLEGSVSSYLIKCKNSYKVELSSISNIEIAKNNFESALLSLEESGNFNNISYDFVISTGNNITVSFEIFIYDN